MTISFPHIPSTVRVPGNYFDVSPAQANTAQQNLPALLIGQVLPGSAAVAGTPVISSGVAADTALYGRGSVLAGMVSAFRASNLFSPLWVLPLADDPAAVAAGGSITFAGTATAAGSLPLYVAGRRVFVAVSSGTTAATLASLVVQQVAAQPDLPVTAATNATAGQVALTAKNKGLLGNDIDIRLAYRGVAGGEQMPPGITATIAPMAGGATNPSLALPLAGLGALPFEVIISSLTDTASLSALDTLMDDVTGRWAWSREIYGHCYACVRANLGQATTLGLSRNGRHVTTLPIYDTPTPMWQAAATLGAGVSNSVNADPAQPLSNIPLDVLAPPPASRFVFSDRNSLLYEGMSTYTVDQGGQVYTERLITNYQTDPSGAPDTSYLDCETMHTLGVVLRDFHSYFATTFAQKKLVDNSVRIPGGSNLVNPALVRQQAIIRYRTNEDRGLVQNSALFAKLCAAENAGGGRVNITLPLIVTNQLRIVAGLVDFTKP